VTARERADESAERTPVSAVLETTDAQWRRLSPRMLLVHPIVEVGKAFPAILGAFLAGHSSSGGGRWGLIIAAIVIAFSILRYFTTRYRISRDQVQLRHGLLRRKTLAAPLDRVRTVDVSAHLLHRLVGTARVVIGTGTSDRKGRDRLILDGLSAGTAAALRAELLHRERPTVSLDKTSLDKASLDNTSLNNITSEQASPAKGEPVEDELVRLNPAWIRYAPFTLTGAVTGLALLGLGWRVVSEGHVDVNRLAPYRAAVRQFDRWPLALDVGAVLVGVIAFVVIASTAGYVLAFWRFRLTRHSGGTLHVTRGLITSRATSIERRRLRGAELSEPLLLRWAGGARCLAIATGLRVGRGAERGGEILLPPAPRRVAVRVADDVLETPVPFAAELAPHPGTARRRRLIRALAGAAVISAAVVVAVVASGATLWLATTAVLPVALAVPLALDRYRSLGHAIVAGHLVTSFGSLVRRRCVIEVDGVIGWNVRATFFQRRLGLATLTATTAAGRQRYAISDVAGAEALRFADAVPGLLREFLA
jgi:putative membrane protein